jgi:hypothetical protein
VADRIYKKFFQYIVKFPDGVEPPDEFKPADGYEDYIGVESFTEVCTPPEARVNDDSGHSANVVAMPAKIVVHQNLSGKVKPLIYEGKQPDWEVELIQLAKEDKGKPDPVYRLKLEGVQFLQYGPETFVVAYDRFKSEKFSSKGPPDTDGYDFLLGKYLG